MPQRVLICDAKATSVEHALQEDALEACGATAVPVDPVPRTESALIEALEDAVGVIVDANVPVTARVLEAAPDLQVVGRAGTGVDNVDLEAAADHGVTVCNHPTYSVEEVATHTLTLLLAALRRLPRYDRDVRAGGWDWGEGVPVPRLREVTVGLVGFGAIPRRLATTMSGFGCEILAADPYVSDDLIRAQNVEPTDLEDLLARSDALSIHCPLTEETEGLIGRAELEAVPEDAVVVNTARGRVIDTDALVAALEADVIGFAALDVTDPEPLPAEHPLRRLENALVTPHTGWYSEGSRRQLSREIAEDVGRVLAGEGPENEVAAGEGW